MSKKYKVCLAMLCSILLLLSNTAYATQTSNYQTKAKSNNKQTNIKKNTSQINTKQEDTTKKAGWKLKDINSWYYYDQNGKLKTGWLHYKTGKYYLNTKAEGKEGLMRLGWYTDKKGDKYFFNTIYGANFGKAVTGWNWIAGHKYYFDKNGKLYVNTKAPDGHKVNKEGQWIKNTKVQHIKGKGLPLKPIDFKLKLKKIKDISSNSISKNNNNYNSYGSGGSSSNNNTNKSQYTVVFDFNDSITSSQSSTVNAGEYVQPPDPSPKQDYYFLGWYKEKEPQDLYAPFAFQETPINKDMTLYGVWIDTKNDTDGDGLLDGMEQILKTDIHKIDTDNDGLTDYQEYYYTATSPINPYSYVKNILDSNLDIDSDGLTNKEEVEFGSNPIFDDKDRDELNDLQEKQYGTNPNNKDTDDDGLLDGLEIKYGFNPLKPDTNGNGILDKDEIITVDVNYQGEGTSKPTANIKLKASSADNLLIQRDDPQESNGCQKKYPDYLMPHTILIQVEK